MEDQHYQVQLDQLRGRTDTGHHGHSNLALQHIATGRSENDETQGDKSRVFVRAGDDQLGEPSYFWLWTAEADLLSEMRSFINFLISMTDCSPVTSGSEFK